MKAVHWNPALEIGIPLIDDQHQTLIGLVNEMQRVASSEASRERVSDILEELEIYTLNHFRDEEEFMAAIGYEFLDLHRDEHQELARQVVEYREQFSAGRMDAMDLVAFLLRWLVTHIGGSDSHIAYCLRQQEAAQPIRHAA